MNSPDPTKTARRLQDKLDGRWNRYTHYILWPEESYEPDPLPGEHLRHHVGEKVYRRFERADNVPDQAIRDAITILRGEARRAEGMLNWVHFAIQEALNGNLDELERALGIVEDLRDGNVASYQS